MARDDGGDFVLDVAERTRYRECVSTGRTGAVGAIGVALTVRIQFVQLGTNSALLVNLREETEPHNV